MYVEVQLCAERRSCFELSRAIKQVVCITFLIINIEVELKKKVHKKKIFIHFGAPMDWRRLAFAYSAHALHTCINQIIIINKSKLYWCNFQVFTVFAKYMVA